MQKPVPTSLTFYPAYCFSLSPTYNTWARLTVAEVHALKQRAGFEGQNLYFHLNHPIRWIRLVGVIVAFDVFPTRWIMLLDDISGALIEVTCGQPAPTVKAADPLDDFSNKIIEPDIPLEGVTATGRTIDLHRVDIGTVVKVKGGIGSWKGEKQMHLERICTLCLYSIYLSSAPPTKKPPSAWAENIAFRKSILNNPWSVSENDEKRVRRKAEGLDCERKARDERKKRKENAERDGKLNALQKRRQKALEEGRRAEKERDEEARRATEKAERERQEEAVRLAAEREKKERDKGRREQERRLRELKYERLMMAKEGEGG